MTISCISRCIVLVASIGMSQVACCQFKNLLDSILTQSGKLQQIKDEANPANPHLKNPLGPTAQLLRANSYKAHKCDDSSETNLSRGLWIMYNDIEYLYRDQTLYAVKKENGTSKFSAVMPNRIGKQVKKTINTLQMLERRSAYAKNIISTLQESENKFIISLKKTSFSYILFPLPNGRLGVLNNNAYAFQVIESEQLVVDYAPFDKIGSGAEIRWTPKHKKIKLAHELAHAYDANFGLLDDRLMQAYGIVMPAREIRALFHENMIRKELRKELRIDLNYGSSLVVNGVPYTYPLPVPARY